MNESDMPREWWHDQDQDEAWIKQQEEELQQQEDKFKRGQIWQQLELDLGPPA
jgi:hypothetical protein